MKPHELLPDGLDSLDLNGQTVRKGTIGAFIQNALALADPRTETSTRQTLEAETLELIPSMQALQLFDIFDIRDSELRRLVASKYPDIQGPKTHPNKSEDRPTSGPQII